MADERAERIRDESADAAAWLEAHREEYHDSLTRMQDTWEQGKEDQEFLAGEQWDSEIEKERQDDGRPCMTFPKLTQFHDSLLGTEMQQRPSIKIRPADGVASGKNITTAAGKTLTRAEAYAGIVRQIERQSFARAAYDNAFEGATGWGWGHWRIDRVYVEDSFDQEAVISPILDPFAVVWDGSATDYLRLEADWCDVETTMSKKAFERQYPGATAGGMDLSGVSFATEWIDGNDVKLREHFRRVEYQVKLLRMTDGSVYKDDEKFQKVKDDLARQGIMVHGERMQKAHKVEWRLITALDVLEGPIPLPGRYIPIVPVWGRPTWKQGRIVYRGLIRNAKDEQRSYNYTRTALVEKQALAPKAPWLATAEQVEGHEDQWDNAHKKNFPYLLYNDVAGADGKPLPPPQRQFGTIDVAADVAILQLSEAGMKSSIGIYDPTLGQNRDQRSGKALAIEADRTDTMTYPFMSNLARSIGHTGTILVNWIPEVYDAARVARILHEDEGEDTIEINTRIVDEESGETVMLNDVTVGRYDVTADVGPSYLTRRLEAIDSLLSFLEKMPQAAPLLGDLIAKNADWPPGLANEAARRLAVLLPPELQDSEEGGDDNPEVARLKAQVKQATDMLEQQMMAMQEELKKLSQERDHLKAQVDKVNVQITAEREAHGLSQEREALKYERNVMKLERQVDKLMAKVEAATRKSAEKQAPKSQAA